MSTWTHVAGIICIDHLIVNKSDELDFDELIGKECLWSSSDEIWEDQEKHPNKYLPMGSEGSLQKSIWINPDKDLLSTYTISIFGSLRDFSNIDSIISWFKSICDKFCVRNATITAENDINGIKTFTYDPYEDDDLYIDFERKPYEPDLWVRGVKYE